MENSKTIKRTIIHVRKQVYSHPNCFLGGINGKQ